MRPTEPEPKAPVVVEVGSIATIPKSALMPAPGSKMPEPKIAKVEDTVTGAVSTVINTVLNPFSVNSTPDSPAEPAAAWAMLAFARREFEHAFRQPRNLLTQVSTLSAVTARGPVALAPGIVVPDSLVDNVNVTEGPSLFDQVTVLALTAFREISEVIGVDITTSLGGGIAVPNPPPILTVPGWMYGRRSSATRTPTVSSRHGRSGNLEPKIRLRRARHRVSWRRIGYPPNILHWLDQPRCHVRPARTVIVPRYRLILAGWDRRTTRFHRRRRSYLLLTSPNTARRMSVCTGNPPVEWSPYSQCRRSFATARVTPVRQQPEPSRMVLSSPGLTDPEVFTDPNVVLVNDPLFGVPESERSGAVGIAARTSNCPTRS